MNAELLIGRKVIGIDGKKLGHIEELVAERRGNDVVVTEVHVGRGALAERLSAHGVAMAFLGLFGARRRSKAPQRINWSDLDFSDPRHVRVKPL
jgi:sporulation protein YlmC with PRC-barrel domain